MSEPTVRERLEGIRQNLASDNVTTMQTRNAMVQLTALWGWLTQDARAKEFAYRKVLAEHLAALGVAAKAKVMAEGTDSYLAYREAQGLADEVDQMVISCRRSLQSLDNEYRKTR